MLATRWQLTYRTEAIDATTFEAPRNPLVTPMMTYVAGITDIEFTIDALWDTCGIQGNPYGFPDLRPGTRPVIDLFVKKGPNNIEAPVFPTDGGPGMEGTPNPAEQVFRFVAVIADCTTDSEVRGLVKYTISGSADPEILEEDYDIYYAGEYFSTGIWLPTFGDEQFAGPAFSSQNNYQPGSWIAEPFISTNGNEVGPFDYKPGLSSGSPPFKTPSKKGDKGYVPASGDIPRTRTANEEKKKTETPATPPPPPASL